MSIALPLSSVIRAVCVMGEIPYSWQLLNLDGFDAVADLDLVDDVHALRDLAERRVLAVQEVRVAEHEVHLARRGIGIVRARHAEHAAVERLLVELGLERLARPALTHLRLVHRGGLRQRIPELHDELRLHAVHALPVVETLARELREVLDVVRRDVRPELERDLSAALHGDDRGWGLGALRRRERERHEEGEQNGERDSAHARASDGEQSRRQYTTAP